MTDMDELHKKTKLTREDQDQLDIEAPDVDLSKRLFGAGIASSLLGVAGCISEQPGSSNPVLPITRTTPQSPNDPVSPISSPLEGDSNPEPGLRIDAIDVPDVSVNPRTFNFLSEPVTLGVSDMQGQQTMSDGTLINVWGFTSINRVGFNGDRSLPGPVIELIEGERAYVTLQSSMPHSIHLHGLDVDQMNDGVPLTSGFVAGFNGILPGNFGRVNGYNQYSSPHDYVFTAPHAGTYMYHCHVDTSLHMEMGMAGTIIVRPPDGNPNTVWLNGPVIDREYVWHLHTFDSRWHAFRTSNANTVRYNPDYFLLNGKEGAGLLDDLPTSIQAAPGERVLIRCVNIGILPAIVTLGNHVFDIIAVDGRPLPAPITLTSQLIGPGERYDLLLIMPAAAQDTATVEYLSIVNVNSTNISLGKAETSLLTI